MKRLLFAIPLLFGCASSRDVVFEANAIPAPAAIEVNGMVICDSTPCKIMLRCGKAWVGLANAPGGQAPTTGQYGVTAIPLKAEPGQKLYTSTKHVDPCLVVAGDSPKLLFRMDIEPVAPTQPVEIRRVP